MRIIKIFACLSDSHLKYCSFASCLSSSLAFEDVVQTIADLDPEHLLLDKEYSDTEHPVQPASKMADDKLTFPGSGREYYYYKLPHKVSSDD